MGKRLCSVAACVAVHLAKGLCRKHYMRVRQGTPLLKADYRRACCVPGCVREHTAKGYCKGHYQRLLAGGDLLVPLPPARHCSEAGCGRIHAAHGLCEVHANRVRKGIPGPEVKRRGRPLGWRPAA